jgi:hypothetical protein
VRRRLILACTLLAACGLFPDLSGLSGGDAATTDAADVGPPADAQPSDGQPPDAPPSDGQPPDAQPTDAGDAGFCATHPGHAFCEDFDEPNFAARWDSIATTTGSTAVEDDASSTSPPNAMLGTVTFAASSSSGTAYARKHFGTATTFQVRAELLVDPTSLAQIDPVEIKLQPPPTGYSEYQIHVDVGTKHLGWSTTPADGGASSNSDLSFTNTLSSWQNVEIDFDLSTAIVKVLVNGATVVGPATLSPVSPTGFDVELGVVKGSNTSNAPIVGTVHVDDVLVDLQ